MARGRRPIATEDKKVSRTFSLSEASLELVREEAFRCRLSQSAVVEFLIQDILNKPKPQIDEKTKEIFKQAFAEYGVQIKD